VIAGQRNLATPLVRAPIDLHSKESRPLAVRAEVPNLDSATMSVAGAFYRDADHVIAVHENTVLTFSSDAPNPHYLEAWTRAVALVAERFPAGLLALTIINRHAHAPDDPSKAHIRSTVMRHGTEIRAFAYVVEGEGFGAATVRSAISLISLAARYPFPMKVFEHVEGAVPWMLSRPIQGARRPADPAKLISIANALRGQLQSDVATG
jgi:hypothetical protein